jgi:hypothetical protein
MLVVIGIETLLILSNLNFLMKNMFIRKFLLKKTFTKHIFLVRNPSLDKND